MDPFSITASIVTLIQVSAQVTVLVKQFRDEVNVVDTTVNGILNDVEGFQQVLQSMKETFAQEDIQADVQATGHVGSHWKNLARSLSDGESTLDQLRSLLTSVNKSTSFLDASRKQLRLKSALAQISGFRDQIQSYRAALQLSLSTIIVWNQVTLQKSTAKLPERIMPNLNKLYDQIRNLGADLNAKIGKLESTVASQGFHAESELMSMTNLKECVESAADVVSTASTTLGPEGNERASKFGSDFGDVFKKDSNETMQRWMSSNTVYEFDDVETPTLEPSEASTGDAITIYESDSDSDIDHELVRALFNKGKKLKEQGDLHGAERRLRNCLTRFPSTTSYKSLASSQTSPTTGVSKAELLELLTETYCLQGSWTQAKVTMKEKLAITERQAGKRSERFLWDSFRLSEVLMNTKDYTEAQLHGRQSLRGFRKLREQGHIGYEKTLVLLIQVCHEQGNLEDEEAYTALLGSHQTSLNIQEPTLSTDIHMVDATADFTIASPSTASPIERSSRRQSGHDNDATQTRSKSPASLEPQDASAGKDVFPSVPTAGAASEGSSSESSMRVFDARAASGRANSTAKVFVLDGQVESASHASPSHGKGKRQLTPLPTLKSVREENPSSPASSANVPMQGSLMESVRSRNDFPPSEIVRSNTELVRSLASKEQTMLSDSAYAYGRDSASYTRLLINLCQQELGKKPIFMIGRGREGYNCIVFADDSQQKEIAKVSGRKTKDEARHAAAAKAYKTLVSLPTQSKNASVASGQAEDRPINEIPASDSGENTRSAHKTPDVDPPAYTPNEGPSHLTSPTGFLQDIPEILVSPTIDNATFKAMHAMPQHSLPIRRSASDSRITWQKTLVTQDPAVANSHVAGPWKSQSSTSSNEPSTHRRAASTSTRLPEWKSGDEKEFARPPGLGIAVPPAQVSQTDRKRPTAQPSVTFDSIESSLEQPDHSNPDATSPSTRGFSLLPSALAKTLSLQDRRSKSDDPNLMKKKSFRFGLLSSSSSNGSSSKRKSSITTSPKREDDDVARASQTVPTCPICSSSLQGHSDDEAWSHVDSCLAGPSLPPVGTTYELPASNFFAAELPASTPTANWVVNSASPKASNQYPSALSDLHRAFSRRDLSADRFEVEDEVRLIPPTPMSPLSRFELNPLQRQVLLLGDTQCGRTWLSSAWCTGSIPKHTSLAATNFTKCMGSLEIVIQDHTGLGYIHDQIRHGSYGVVHAVLLCFDISSPESFENVEHKWNHEADLYLKDVPKILVGCKKDINRGGLQTVWSRDAYKLTARISARAYFETSAVTMEGLDLLFNHVAQIAPR